MHGMRELRAVMTPNREVSKGEEEKEEKEKKEKEENEKEEKEEISVINIVIGMPGILYSINDYLIHVAGGRPQARWS